MKNLWKEIINEIKNISPKIYKSLNKPASMAKIHKLEKELGLEIPSSFKEYLSVCNGQNHQNIFYFIGYNPFLSIDEIIKDWKLMNRLFLDEEPISFISENKIKPMYWNKKWIPISNFEGSNRIIIDLDAGRNGTNGQVFMLTPGVDLESDDTVLSDSFEKFSQKILNTLKNNSFSFEDGVIECDWLI